MFELYSPPNAIDVRQKEELYQKYFGESLRESSISYSDQLVLVSAEFIEKTDRICRILDKAFRAIVRNYFMDERIREIYRLDSSLETILREADDKPYFPGYFRPDFLFEESGQAKICEIGARFPLNGWMLSFYLNEIYREINAGDSLPFSPIPKQDEIVENLYSDLKLMNQSTIALIRGEEKGTEIFYLKRELEKREINFLSLKYQDLEIYEDRISFEKTPLDQIILEMDREELKNINPEILKKLIAQGNYFNDVRTLILIHDKRVLAVLFDEKIMRDYLTAEDYAFLQPWLIPTFVIKNAAECKKFIESEINLIIKMNSGGRGLGAYVKNECSREMWSKILKEQWNNYVVQHFVAQQKYFDQELQKDINLVGMLLCKNEQSFGPGIFRGSTESVVNVFQGRAQIHPALLRKNQI